MDKPSVVFCGKHRVNFAMFEPVYQRLRHNPGLWLGVSSGCYRRKPILGWLGPKDPALTNEKIFAEFDIDPAHLVKTSWHDKREFDVYVTSNLSVRITPPAARTKVQIFHGVSFRNFAVYEGYARFDKLFFPGRYMMEQYIARGILKEGDPRIEVMGMPKLDRLVNGEFNREEILGKFGLDPALRTVVWAPTGARYNSFEKLGGEGARAIEAAGVNLILKPHDHPHLPKGTSYEDFTRQARAALGPRGRLATHSDVAPLLSVADLLVSDASSVAYEYCVVDRPIVFVDVPELLQRRADMPESAMDTNTHGRKVGSIVAGARELGAAIGEELANPNRLSPERRAAADHIFHQPGTAAARIAARLCELAGLTAQSAAA